MINRNIASSANCLHASGIFLALSFTATFERRCDLAIVLQCELLISVVIHEFQERIPTKELHFGIKINITWIISC